MYFFLNSNNSFHTSVCLFLFRVYVLDKGWKSILEASYNGTLTNYFEVGDAEDFALYNVTFFPIFLIQ